MSVKNELMAIVQEVASQISHPVAMTMLPLLLKPLETMPEEKAREVARVILRYSRRLEAVLDGLELDRPQR